MTNQTTSQPTAPDKLGPNGHPTGYNDNGDFVEWLPDDETPGETVGTILRRSDDAILKEYEECRDKVWWNRHQVWKESLEDSGKVLSLEEQATFNRAEKHAQEIEAKYGADNLGWDDFEWGLLSGNMSALAWMLGSEWEESLDT